MGLRRYFSSVIRSTITKKTTNLLLLFFIFVPLGVVLLYFDEAQRVQSAPSQCPRYSCQYSVPSGCTMSEKEHQQTPIDNVATVGREGHHGGHSHALLPNQTSISTSSMPSNVARLLTPLFCAATIISTLVYKLPCVALGIAMCGFVATQVLHLLFEMPAKCILWCVVLAYAVPLLLGLFYEHCFNTPSERRQNNHSKGIQLEGGDTD
ncbi:hypothetical protein Q7P35_002737 [Cladosporium inversicolor]